MSGADVAARTRRIRALADELGSRVRGVPEAALHRVAPEGWSAAHVLAHVVEFAPYWAGQAEAVAGRREPGAPFGRTADDPERSAAIERRWRDTGGRLAADLSRALDDSATRLERIPAAGWARTGRHARRGEMTVAGLVDLFLVEHLEEHQQQVARALAEADPAPP